MSNKLTELLSGKRAVVTGGLGFIGSNLIELLLEKNFQHF